MLIRFSIENFLSFNDRQTFSLLPGLQRLKPEHKTSAVDGISVLKTAVLFGANASGKSNLIKAIAFGQNIVIMGTRPDKQIMYSKFKLDKNSNVNNSRIEYEIRHKDSNYAYGFIFNHQEIVEEWLYKIDSKKDTKIFERKSSAKEEFDLKNILSLMKNEEERSFFQFVAKATPRNQLLLTEVRTRRVSDNVSGIDDLLNVIDWFQNVLRVIFPDDKYKEGLKYELKQDTNLLSEFEEFLDYFDTGIDGVCLEKVDEKNTDIPPMLISKLKEDLLSKKSNKVRATIVSNKNTTFFLSVKNNEVVIEKFMTKHKVKDADTIEKFDTSEESDGTNRIMDFIPLLLDLLRGDNVFIIDEMERSLHPNLIYDLLDLFLSNAENIDSQLILASHESSLLTQKLLRKDEVWFAVKDKDGSSKLHSLEEYNVRFDKEIRRDYLLGRFKAIPRIGSRNQLTALKK